MKCPFRFREFAEPHMQECVNDCALLMVDLSDNVYHQCALAVIASMTGRQVDNAVNSFCIENEQVDE